MDLPDLTIVVIGYNEGNNLDETFFAIRNVDYPQNKIEIIYVDSGSIDNSVEVALRYTPLVFSEPIWPTAARNRNRGLIESSHNIIHFLDGDVMIDPQYLKVAVKKLLEGEVQAVCGPLKDKNVTGLGKVLLHDYSNRQTGYVDAPGAGGTFLKKALLDVNGWDERIPRGEESELGERIRGAGYRIWYTDYNMGIHDYGISNIFQYCKKQIRQGLAVGAISKIETTGILIRKTKIRITNNIIIHVLFLLFIVMTYYFNNIWVFVGIIGLSPIYLLIKYRLIKGVRNADSLKLYFLMNYTRSLVLYGYIKFNINFLLYSKVKKRSFYKRMNVCKHH